jgi:hypothetical protein
VEIFHDLENEMVNLCVIETDVIVELVASRSLRLSQWNTLSNLNLLLQRLWFRIAIITILEVEPTITIHREIKEGGGEEFPS